MRAALVALLAAGCQQNIANVDGAFDDWSGRKVLCGVDLDNDTYNSLSSVDSALDRARDRGEVAMLYAHKPGVTVDVSTIEHVLSGARDRGLTFYTFEDLADPATPAGPGLALSFDDTSTDAWWNLRPLFDQYGAHVTFFVSRYKFIRDDQKAQIHDLASDGHAIEAHTVLHLRAPDYVEQYGIDAYMHDEVIPSIDLLRADGYPVSAFAYPFGVRTGETDRAILDRVSILRSVVFTWPEVDSPCPY